MTGPHFQNSEEPAINLKRIVGWLQPFRSVFLSTLCIIALLGILLLSGKQTIPEKVTIRTISVGLPPPPPPPPSQVESTEQTMRVQMDLLSSIDERIALASATVETPVLTPPSLPFRDIRAIVPVFDSAFSFDWSGFGLSELDEKPRLLTRPMVRFPQNLRERGISRVFVELDVMIDEGGRVFLREILKNPHPQLNSEIRTLLQRVRFTAPKKSGRPVRAVFIWPVEFADE